MYQIVFNMSELVGSVFLPEYYTALHTYPQKENYTRKTDSLGGMHRLNTSEYLIYGVMI